MNKIGNNTHFKILFFPLDIYIPLAYILSMTKAGLKKWRKVNSYSQAQLAKSLGVAVMTVSRWETGLRSIPVFLHLALRCLEMEGGERVKGMSRVQKKMKKGKGGDGRG